MAAGADAVASFRARYLECLREEVPRPGPGKRVLPGIASLLDALDPHPQTFLGLLTGNFADAAEVKLAHFDLWRYFRCGAFGEDAHDRNHLVPVALHRARDRGLPDHVGPARTIVIGDTPRDIACARAHGARVVAVATGEYSVEALKDADVVFADFSDTQAALDAIFGF
jgi:phosphoglycolate phosphatase